MKELSIALNYGGDDPGEFHKLKADIDQWGTDAKTRDAVTALASAWEDRDAPWTVTVTWATDGKTATPIAVELRARQGQPVTPETWRAVRVATVISETRARLGWQVEHVANVLAGQGEMEAAVEAQRSSDALSERPRRGRRSIYDAAHYARVADLYNDTVRTGDKQPIRTIARKLSKDLGDPQLKKDNRVKAWVREARKRGFIRVEG